MKIVTTILLTLMAGMIWSQNYNYGWAFSLGGNNEDFISDIAYDSLGNVYITGEIFTNSVDFDPGPSSVFLSSTPSPVFVAKYNPEGELVWAKNTGGDYSHGLAVDHSGNIYVVGQFSGTHDFDPGSGTASRTSNGSSDIYISKLSPTGGYIWTGAVGGSYSDQGRNITVDSLGNVVVTGTIRGIVDFDPNTGQVLLAAGSNTESSIFVLKLNNNGFISWAKVFQTVKGDNAYSHDVDSYGNIYITGSFKGTTYFNGSSSYLSTGSDSNVDAFVCKLGSSGNFDWAKKINGTSNSQTEVGYSIKTIGYGFYLAGSFTGTADFDMGSGYHFSSTTGPTGTSDIFIAKYDYWGELLWVKTMGSTSNDIGASLDTDSDENPFLAGVFSATVDFDPGASVYNLSSNGNWDVFVAQFNTSGDFMWAKSFGGASNDLPERMGVDSKGNVFVGGYFTGSMSFGTGPTLPNLVSNNYFSDAFLLKINPPLEAAFSSSNPNILAGDTVFFYDESPGTPSNWFWDFGDGQTNSSQNPAHIYSDTGTFDVTLIVGNSLATDTIKMQDYVSVGSVQPILISYIVTDLTCTSNDGAIDLSVSGGVPPYTYNWSNGATTEDVGNLYAWNLSVTVTDQFGNEETAHIQVSSLGAMDIDYETVGVDMANCTIGQIDVSVSGAAPPFSYNWNLGDTTQDIFNIPAVNYSLTVTDANGCSRSKWVGAKYLYTDELKMMKSSAIGGWGSHDKVLSMASNDSSYIVLAGSFDSYNLNLGDTLLQNLNPNSTNSFAAKKWTYGANAETVWVLTTSTTNGTSFNSAEVVAVSPDGNTYIGINFYGDITLGSSTFYCIGGRDILFAKIDSHGNIVWAQQLGGNGFDVIEDIKINPQFDIFVAGSYTSDSINLGNTTLYKTGSLYSRNSFIFKTDENGAISWANKMGGGSTNTRSIACDENGSVIVAGNFSSYEPPVFENDTLTGFGSYDIYLVKYTNQGTQQWVESFGGSGYDAVTSIDIDDDSNIYLSGYFSDSISMGSTNLSGNSYEALILKLDPMGQPMWANSFGGDDHDEISKIMIDNSGDIIMAGKFYSQSIEIDNYSFINHTSGTNDIFFAKADTAGNFLWASHARGNYWEDIECLATCNSDKIFAGGYTSTDLIVDLDTLTNIFNSDGFLLEFSLSGIQISDSTMDVSCYQCQNGAIDISVCGGYTPYSYSWSNGDTSEDLSSIPVGTYQVTITDNWGRTTKSPPIPVGGPDTLTLQFTTINSYCWDEGAIDLTVSGGAQPYSYSWSNGAINEDLRNLLNGNYSVTVIDGSGNTASGSITVESDVEIWADVIIQNDNGTGSGSIQVSAFGTNPWFGFEFMYDWSNGSYNNTLTNLTAGSYWVDVSDSLYCTKRFYFEVLLDTNQLDIQGNVIKSSCGYPTGKIILSVSGGTSPYSYNWSNGDTLFHTNHLAAGSYTVTVTDVLGNSSTKSFFVSVASSLQVFDNIFDNVNCYGNSTGFIIPGNEYGSYPYSYLWSTGDTTLYLINIPAGNYGLTITDAHNCVFSETFNIAQPDSLDVSAIVTEPVTGSNNGAVDISVIGGTSPYYYEWSNGQTTGSINNLPTGVYSLTLWDSNGCEDISTYELIGIIPTTVTQVIPIDTAWNLISFYIEPSNNSLPSVFGNIMPYLQAVKKPGANWLVTNPPILNDLNHILNGEAYWVKTNANCTIQSEGTLIDPGTFLMELDSGWNSVAYISQQQQLVTTALADIVPVLVEVKARASFWRKTNNPLLNTLTTLKPGFGYYINVSADTSFYFPQGSKGMVFGEEEELPVKPVIYTNSTSMIGELLLEDETILDEGSFLVAKVGDEVRAVSRIYQIDGKPWVSLLITGEETETVHFELFSNNTSYLSETIKQTMPGKNIGTYIDPSLLKFSSISFDENQVTQNRVSVKISPNPFSDKVTISLNLKKAGAFDLRIYNSEGKEVKSTDRMNLLEGDNLLFWDGKNNTGQLCPSGTYHIRISGEGSYSTENVIFIKN